jgi:hypothetical protein
MGSNKMETNYVIKPNAKVLVLNSSYEVIDIQSWKKATLKVFKKKAEIVKNNVIRLLRYVKLPYSRTMACYPTRPYIFKRDDHTCQYCGCKEKLTLDHVHPQSRGGQDTWENLVTSCGPCNAKKGNRTPSEAGMVLHKIPHRPFNKMHLEVSRSKNDSWISFIHA